MPEPILPRGIRAQVVLPGRSGLPEDRFVNTWHFQVPGPAATEADEVTVANHVRDFYTLIPAGLSNPISTYISSAVDKPNCTIRTYQLGQAVPREVTVHTMSLGIGDEGNMPEEVALCLSFFSVRNLPRQRGRVYIGPLVKAAAANDTVSKKAIAIVALTGLVRAAALGLANKDNAVLPHWCVLSKAGGLLHPVTDGWVDDSFDTQRRRGRVTTVRNSWGPVLQ